jgi:hypothetical protein
MQSFQLTLAIQTSTSNQVPEAQKKNLPHNPQEQRRRRNSYQASSYVLTSTTSLLPTGTQITTTVITDQKKPKSGPNLHM